MNDSVQRVRYWGAVISLISLLVLGLAWELILAPLRPGGSWMALKVVPLLLPLRGVIRRDIYTFQWSSMLILLYVGEGLVRATSDHGLSAALGWVEVALSTVFFLCAIFYLRPYKRAAKKIAQQAIKKASESVNE